MTLLLLIVLCVVAYRFHIRIRKLEGEIRILSGENTAARTVDVRSPAPSATSGSDTPEISRDSGVAEGITAPPPVRGILSPMPEGSAASREERWARNLGRVGAAAVLIGVSYFLKYAFEHDWIPPALRVALGVLFGLAFAGIAQYLRNKDSKYLRYSDILFGGSIGVLYLSVYAAFDFYHLIDQTPAFLLMILVTVFGLVISVTGDSLGLAILAVLGGFATPILVSSGTNQLAALSSYMIILDLGVFVLALWKRWFSLNALAFVATALLFFGWFIKFFYASDQVLVTFFFASLFHLVFLATGVAHHFVRKESSGRGDLELLVANAALYFGFSTFILWKAYHPYLGFFALFLAALYLLLAYASYATNVKDRTLNLFLPGIAIIFLTIAVPLQLSGYFITIAWLTEALILVATGLFLRERLVQFLGWIVLAFGFVSLFQDVALIRLCRDQFGEFARVNTQQFDGLSQCDVTPFFNTGFFLMLLGVAAIIGMSVLYHKFRENAPIRFAVAAFLLANIAFISAVTTEIIFAYNQDIKGVSREVLVERQNEAAYRGSNGIVDTERVFSERMERERGGASRIHSLENSKNTAITIFWTAYALIVLFFGFAKRIRGLRIFGLAFFFIIAAKVFIDVWNLGQVYKIISSIVFGLIALIGSLLYAKYRERLQEIIAKE